MNLLISEGANVTASQSVFKTFVNIKYNIKQKNCAVRDYHIHRIMPSWRLVSRLESFDDNNAMTLATQVLYCLMMNDRQDGFR